MKYFVIGSDGSKYGPADTTVLTSWRQEGRLNDDTWLEEEGSSKRYQAKEILGPSQPTPPSQPVSPPPPGGPEPQASPYPRQEPYQGPPKDNGKVLVIFGWILAVTSLCCCPPLTGGAAIVLGVIAKKRGHPGAQALIIAAVIMLVVGIVFGIILNLNNAGFQEMIRDIGS